MKLPLLIISSLFLFILSISSANAEVMSNGTFKIEMGNLNSIAGETSGSNYSLNITSGETAPGLYEGSNYKVKAGFQYIPRRRAFTFSVSNKRIDFGILSPTNPVTRTSTLTVSNTSAPSYQVTAAQNHQLLVPRTGAIIPDTTCDRGSCNERVAAAWANTLTYGFGYRCDPVLILTPTGKSESCVLNDSSFTPSSNFKQFSDASRKESAQVVLSGAKGRNQKATITYKVNISSSQATGAYQNAVTYIATPGF